MFRRFAVLCDRWKDKIIFPREMRGRYNVEEAAKEIDIDPDLAKAMYKPIQYTFCNKWQRYPAEMGRNSRPGESGSRRKAMFPLLEKNKRIDKMRQVSPSAFSTF